MSIGAPGSLRVALLLHDSGTWNVGDGVRHVGALARALGDRGHHAEVQRDVSPVAGAADSLLRRRGFIESIAHVPLSALTLLAGGCDVAHAFSATDALSALAWRRLTGRPVVFTCMETLRRERLADRRLRLSVLRRAVEDTDAAIAASPDARVALQRWLAVDAPVIEAGDALSYERVYRELVVRR